MNCSKCGTELVEQGKIKEKTYYKCPNCNFQPVYNEFKADWEPEKKKIGCLAILGIFIAFIVGMCFFAMLICGTAIGGNGGLIVQSIGFTALAIAALIFTAIKKMKSGLFIVLGIVAIYYLLLLGAVNDFPEFIRSIQGEDFVALWWKYDIAVYVIAILAEILTLAFIIRKSKDGLVNMNYSDSDLMLLQGFSNFKLTGYYLLKAKLHGIINFVTTQETEDTDSMVLVELNKAVPENEREYYCEQNPQVKKIVEFLKSRDNEQYEYTRVADVVNGVKPEPEIQSLGGQAAVKMLAKLKDVRRIIFWIAIALVYYVGLTKLFMGMHNEKAIEDLSLGGFVVSYFMLAIFFGITRWIFNNFILPAAVNMIVKKKQIDLPNYEQYVQSFMTSEIQANAQEQQNILRYYATYPYSPEDYKTSSNANIAYSILNSVFISEAIAAQAKRSSGSGCSSCSGCGGCGGGCGGCGGCGD